MANTNKHSESTDPKALNIALVRLSVFEKMTYNEAQDELKSVRAEIEALKEKETALENECFWKLNPKCRPH